MADFISSSTLPRQLRTAGKRKAKDKKKTTIFASFFFFSFLFLHTRTAIGLRVKDGVVFGVEKLVSSKMLVEGSGKRIFHVGRHAALCVAGLQADARQLVLRARAEASSWSALYGSDMPVALLAERVAGYVHQFTLFASARPFGCSVLVSGHDAAKGYQLFCIDPTGNCFGYRGTSIGKAASSGRNEIEKLKLEQLTAREAVREAARIIHAIHDEIKDRDWELELSYICDETNKIHTFVPADMQRDAVAAATAANQFDD